MATRGVCVLAGRIAETVQIAAAADAAGYDGAWTGEFNDRSAIVALAAMAHNTSGCRIGSAIAYGVGRSPLILANDARGLDELSGGRLVLGLGTGTKGMQIGWHGVTDPESPALRLEELVPLLRRIWRLHAGPVKHEGRFYSMNLTPTAEVLPPTRDQIPIFTAGVNRRMIETAGRVSDGLVCHPTFSSRYVHEVVRPAIARGALRTGRDPASVEIVGMLLCSVNEDAAVARREVAAQIAFYAAPRAYAPMFEASGSSVSEPVADAARRHLSSRWLRWGGLSQTLALGAFCSQMGSDTEFTAVYAREIERVLIFLARRTLDVTLAADLAAETFAIAFRGWPRLTGRTDEEIRAWLFTVARRQVSRYLRSARAEQRAVRRLGIQVPMVHEDDIELIEERAGLGALRAEVSARLISLNSQYRDALRLRVVEERPYREVAIALGITEQAARARVSRGLRALRSVLETPPSREELCA